MSPRILTPALIATALVFSAACTTEVVEGDEVTDPADPNNPDPKPDPEPTPQSCDSEGWDGSLEVGGGETCFASVAQGQTLPLIAGPQFGYHVWMGVRCRDCDPSQVVRYGVKDSAGNFVAGQSLAATLSLDGADGYRHTAGIQAYMPGDGFEDPSYLGESFTFWVEMTIDGEPVTDEVTVVIDGVEYWSPPCDPDYGCNDGWRN